MALQKGRFCLLILMQNEVSLAEVKVIIIGMMRIYSHRILDQRKTDLRVVCIVQQGRQQYFGVGIVRVVLKSGFRLAEPAF